MNMEIDELCDQDMKLTMQNETRAALTLLLV